MIKQTTSILAIALAALTFGGMSGVASAQAAKQNPQQLVQQYRQKAAQLQQIHQKTIAANPKLAAEQDKFEKQIRKAVEDQGYDVDKGQQRIQEMAQKLQSGDLSDSERQAVTQDFQAERQQMVKARDAALAKPDIQSAGKKLQSDTLTAMKKQDDSTETLLSDLDSLRTKIRAAQPAPGANNG